MSESLNTAATLVGGSLLTLAVKITYAKWQKWSDSRQPYENGRRENIVRSYREMLKRNPDMAASLVEDLFTDLHRYAEEQRTFIVRVDAIERHEG